MQQTHNTDSDAAESRSNNRAGLLDQEPAPSGKLEEYKVLRAADEARQLLDELAGLEYRRADASRAPRPDLARKIRAILLWPVLAVAALVRLIARMLQRRDWRLAGEMRKFLRHPGHFFWFQRVAPEAAAQHFGTSSTEAMTQHARRYGSHAAILLLACVVVVFGGFGNLTTRIISAYADVPHPQMINGNLVVTGDGRELYASAVASNNPTLIRRIEATVVKEGQSLRSIATERGISLETLLYANNLVDPDQALQPGQRLVVPPVTGMLHIVNAGDTVGKIADIYGVDPRVILSYKFNNLDNSDAGTALKPLQEIMVPGGSLPLRTKLYIYTARPGDTLKSIADKFGLNTRTLLDNNDLDNGFKPGQEIQILPVDGVIYRVRKGETLNNIAAYLGTSPDNIINFRPNNVARGIALQAGQSLIVPGGTWPPPAPPEPVAPARPAQPAVNPAPNPAPAAARTVPASNPNNPASRAAAPTQKPAPKPAAPGQAVQKPAPKLAAVPKGAGVRTGSLIWPLRGVITTYFGQYLWYGIHKGLDISRGCGAPIIAADGGTVIEAGWSPWGYGITAVVDHGGGIKTRYAHFSSISVWLGQRVAQGQIVGYEGTTGNSTGCHLHFEVVVNGEYRDPLGWL